VGSGIIKGDSMRNLALLFPGQGAQYIGMGKDFADSFLVARETFQEADDILKEHLSRIVFEGPETELVKTKNSQLGIFVTSAAILRCLPELKPRMCAGLSLGEYTALWASGRLSFKDTLLLVQQRAIFMNEACEETKGTMAAVLGLNATAIDEALADSRDVWVANYNCPGQTVISGTKDGVEAAAVVLKQAGAKRVIPLSVHGAFHSGLMKRAQDNLTPFIARAPMVDSGIDFVMNASGAFAFSVDEIRKLLTDQVTHSVRWEQGILAAEKKKIDLYIEIGCGKTLAGLNKKIGVSAQTLSVEKVADIDEVVGQLRNLFHA
jgi:[acyl-carrier-protein] S-malonyltransferase